MITKISYFFISDLSYFNECNMNNNIEYTPEKWTHLQFEKNIPQFVGTHCLYFRDLLVFISRGKEISPWLDISDT